MNITASGKDLIEKFESDFRKFIHGKETIEFMGKPRKLAKCSNNCCSQHDKSTDGKPNPTSKSGINLELLHNLNMWNNIFVHFA